MKTEQEHLRELIDALSAAKSAATIMASVVTPIRRNSARVDFAFSMRRATVEAESLNFYRNQSNWGMVAVCLDQASKVMITRNDWPKIVELLEAVRAKVLTLANQRRN